jgi:hypothetical protein
MVQATMILRNVERLRAIRPGARVLALCQDDDDDDDDGQPLWSAMVLAQSTVYRCGGAAFDVHLEFQNSRHSRPCQADSTPGDARRML